MCKSCHPSHEEQWQRESSKQIDTRRVLGDLISKAEAMLDFYYNVSIDRSDREIAIKLDLEEAINQAKKYHAEF